LFVPVILARKLLEQSPVLLRLAQRQEPPGFFEGGDFFPLPDERKEERQGGTL
jgi:hypothetical protein